jgi:hypothetical protein
MQVGNDGQVRIRTRIVVFSKGYQSGTVICQHCGSDVLVDITLGQNAVSELSAPKVLIRTQKLLDPKTKNT